MCYTRKPKHHKQIGKRGISISYWNVQGIRQKIEDNDFIKCIKNHDIIGLGETWLNKDSLNTLNIPGYYSHSIIRSKQPGGGLSILINEQIKKGIKIEDVDSEDMLWCKLKKDFFN
uniref:Uncharacterized protein LOC102806336 n=1 Tax=Saccoglossus kowalevskii TaxID=10224 RepID=A0ABM0MQN3_SACKO|nr:PREDICTED: uncharacterized protein LOC102806336 [Saccoglossus kowalevskii]